MLNNLGGTYLQTEHFTEAEGAYKEGTDIERQLATQNPATYASNVAAILRSPGFLYWETDAENAYKEAADFRCELVVRSPTADRADLADTLDYLARAVFWLESEGIPESGRF